MNSSRNKKSSTLPHIFTLLFVIATIIAGAIYVMLSKKAGGLFDPVSIVANVSASSLKQTDGRTNILIMGSDRRTIGNVESVLTDTLIVASVGKLEGDVVLISLPRDLWVQSPKGFYEKINAIYINGGAEDTKKVVENVLGIPIHYYAVVDFNIFRETINNLNGVEINVTNAFEDFEYPVEGNEASNCGRTEEEIKKMEDQPYTVVFPCRYEHLKFEQGVQTMDGDRALKYARSRHGNNGEGTDFARAKRQQQVILAVKNKAMSLGTLMNPIKLKELYDSYQKNVDTDIAAADLQGFYQLSQQVKLDDNKVRSVVFDDRSSAEVGGLLYAPTDTSLYGGAYVLIPRAGDFSQVHAYVQRYLFGTQ